MDKKKKIILLASMLLVAFGNGIPLVARIVAGDNPLGQPFLVLQAIVTAICLLLAAIILYRIALDAAKKE